MLLRILKSNTLFSTLLIPVTGLFFWVHSLRSPLLLDHDLANGAMPLYNLIFNYMKGQDFWQVLISFFLVVINSFLVAQLGSLFLFLKKRSYLPGTIYLITVSSLQEMHSLLPVHLATLFVLIAIYLIFDTYHKKNEITYTFNASFFMAIASLFYLPVVVLFPLVWISIFVLQKDDNWRLLVVPILGFGTPWLFIWAFSFMTDSHSILWRDIVTLLWSRHNSYLVDPYFLLLSFIVIILATLGSISVLSVYQRSKVSTRKYFVILYWMLGLVVIAALGFITIGVEIIALSTVPVAYFISHYLLSDQKKILKEGIDMDLSGGNGFRIVLTLVVNSCQSGKYPLIIPLFESLRKSRISSLSREACISASITSRA